MVNEQGQGRSILVVDDNAPLLAALGEMLEREGWWVKLCVDGTSAIQCASTLVYDAVLVDFGLPGIGGAVVAETIRLLQPRTRIIGISFNDRKREFLAAGADAFLLKPFEIDDIANAVGPPAGSPGPDLLK